MRPLTPITQETYNWLKARGLKRSDALRKRRTKRQIDRRRLTDRERSIKDGQLPLF